MTGEKNLLGLSAFQLFQCEEGHGIKEEKI